MGQENKKPNNVISILSRLKRKEKRQSVRYPIKELSQLKLEFKKSGTQVSVTINDFSETGLSCVFKGSEVSIGDDVIIHSEKNKNLIEGNIVNQELLFSGSSKNETFKIAIKFTKVNDTNFITDYLNFHSRKKAS